MNAVDAFLIGFDCALGLKAKDLRESEAQKAETPGVKKVSPPQAIAELDWPIGVQTKHDSPPPVWKVVAFDFIR
jgi:hypothetical protein